MRTALASWLAGASAGFIVLSLLFLDWRLVLLALPPVVFLAIAGMRPVPAPVLDVVREVSRDRSAVGQEIRVSLRVANRGPPLDLLELSDGVPREVDVTKGRPHIVLALDEGEEVAIDYAISPRVKGVLVFGPVIARSSGASGLEYEEAVIPIRTSIVVAPPLEDIRRANVQPRRTRRQLGQIPSRQIGAGAEFWGLREYVSGDETRRINWKASARFDRLVTNETQVERTGDAVIVLDAREESLVGPLARSTTEAGVRAALALASKILEGRNRVGLVVQREVLDWVYPGFGRKQLYRILDALIRVRPGGEWPFDHVLWVLERFFPRNCQVILVSPLLDREAVETVEGLAARGFAITIVSPSAVEIERSMYADDPTLGIAYRLLRMERESAVSALRRYADVVDWDPREPLAAALKGVSPSPGRR
ncbi:MAG: DUF58 domain-containing protein [Methanobacteriota archaeon]|nr:MAG: DUF58 domain-containing protein [Euryarchaeota archaeon]